MPDVPKGYKQTEVGVIPEDWDATSLGDNTVKIGSGITPTGGERIYKQEGRTFLRSQNVGWGKLILEDIAYIDDETHATFIGTEVAINDVLLNITGASIGRSALADSRVQYGNVNQHVCIIRTKQDQLHPRYLNFFLLSTAGQKQVDSFQSGGNRQGLNFGQIRSFLVPLPPTKAEQEAIAGALSDADALIESLERLIAKKRQIKQGAMQELLTGKRRLPGFSGKWETKLLGDVAERIVGGGTPSRRVPEYWNGNIPWMTVKDFARHSPFGTIEYITKEGLHSSASNLIPRKTLITSTRMALGKAVLFEVDVCINQDLKAIFTKKDTDALFLYYWFQHNESRISDLGSGSTVMGLSLGELKKIPICKPPTQEQTAIAEVLSDMDAEIVTLEARLAKARLVKQGMMQELLTGRIRLVDSFSESVGVETQSKCVDKQQGKHNWQINEAVIIGVLAKTFGSEQYPLARKRCTKLTYLLHRHVEGKADGYLKKAAGPYNPSTKYKGPETIAQKNHYVKPHHNGTYPGFVAGDNIQKAEIYFQQWYGDDSLEWLGQFRYKKTEELELLATVDMAMEDLRKAGAPVNLCAVKQVIQNHPEWEAKLMRDVFSDAHINGAISACRLLFKGQLPVS